MNDTVTLGHYTLKGDRVVTFYDGLLVAKDGFLTIPANRPLWIENAFIRGWNLNPEGVRIWGKNQLAQEVKRQTQQSAESAKENDDVPEKPRRTRSTSK